MLEHFLVIGGLIQITGGMESWGQDAGPGAYSRCNKLIGPMVSHREEVPSHDHNRTYISLTFLRFLARIIGRITSER